MGVGSEGALFLPRLRYQVEVVGEWGKAYSENAVSGRDDICAMAADVMLEYLFDINTSPKVSAEYIYSSGDSDRRLSANSTIGGNQMGTTDEAFNAFGFRDLGIAFAPRLSNLNVYIVGGSFFPLEDHKWFKKMERLQSIVYARFTQNRMLFAKPLKEVYLSLAPQYIRE